MYSKAPSGPTCPHESRFRLTLTCWCLRAEKVEPVGRKQKHEGAEGAGTSWRGTRRWVPREGGVAAVPSRSKESSERLERRAGRRCPFRGGVCQETARTRNAG